MDLDRIKEAGVSLAKMVVLVAPLAACVSPTSVVISTDRGSIAVGHNPHSQGHSRHPTGTNRVGVRVPNTAPGSVAINPKTADGFRAPIAPANCRYGQPPSGVFQLSCKNPHTGRFEYEGPRYLKSSYNIHSFQKIEGGAGFSKTQIAAVSSATISHKIG